MGFLGDDHFEASLFNLAVEFYREGMDSHDGMSHQRRLGNFKFAELMFIRTAREGEGRAHIYLGNLYERDSCDGDYWGHQDQVVIGDDGYPVRPAPMTTEMREQFAYHHFALAAADDSAEGCYKLGDMLRDGKGCKRDPVQALAWYRNGYDLAATEGDAINEDRAARRIARLLEEGTGCPQSFEEAYVWYERAVSCLKPSVRTSELAGEESWHSESLRHAEEGLARVKQELSGTY